MDLREHKKTNGKNKEIDFMADYAQYIDFNDFCAKNSFTYRQGMETLDRAIASGEKAK